MFCKRFGSAFPRERGRAKQALKGFPLSGDFKALT